MGRGDSSGGVLHLGPVPAFESVDHWCCLYIKPYGLDIPNMKEDNVLKTMRGFQTFSASFAQTMLGPPSRLRRHKHPLWGSKTNRWPGLDTCNDCKFAANQEQKIS